MYKEKNEQAKIKLDEICEQLGCTYETIHNVIHREQTNQQIIEKEKKMEENKRWIGKCFKTNTLSDKIELFGFENCYADYVYYLPEEEQKKIIFYCQVVSNLCNGYTGKTVQVIMFPNRPIVQYIFGSISLATIDLDEMYVSDILKLNEISLTEYKEALQNYVSHIPDVKLIAQGGGDNTVTENYSILFD